MKKNIFKRIYDYFFSHESRIDSVVSSFKKAQSELAAVEADIEAENKAALEEISKLQLEMRVRHNVGAKASKIRMNFGKLLGEEPEVKEESKSTEE